MASNTVKHELNGNPFTDPEVAEECYKQQCKFENKLPNVLKDIEKSNIMLEKGNVELPNKKKAVNTCKTEAKTNMSETFDDNCDDEHDDNEEAITSSIPVNNFSDLDKTFEEVRLGSLTAMFKLRKMVTDALGEVREDISEHCSSYSSIPTSNLCF